MASNGFTVRIVAIDNATKAIDAVNKRMQALLAPAKAMQASLGRFANASGITKIGKGLESVARGAFSAFQSLARVVTPLSAITGAASIAGMGRLVSNWAAFGQQLGFSSQRIGVSADQLQTFQGAARLAGSSAGAMTSGLTTLKDAMTDAVGGRNPQALQYFRLLGINIRNANGSMKTATQVLPQIATAISRIRDPALQSRVALGLLGGAGDDLLPVLRGGAGALANYAAMAQRYGVMNQAGVDGARRLSMAQTQVELAVEGLTNSVAQQLAPVLSPLLTQLADWIAKNRALVASKVAEYVGVLATWLKGIDWTAIGKGIGSFATHAKNVADSLGGWKTIGEGLLLFIGGRFLTGMLGPIAAIGAAIKLAFSPLGLAAAGVGFAASRGAGKLPGSIWDTLAAANGLNTLDQGIIENVKRHQGPLRLDQYAGAARGDIGFFQKRGWSRAQANIIEGNLAQESGLNPYSVNSASGAFGLAQWLGPRVAQFKKVEKTPLLYSTRQQQLDFIDWELRNSESGSGNLLRGLTNEGDAGRFGSAYERYGAGEEGNRVAFANGFRDLDLGAGTGPARHAPGLDSAGLGGPIIDRTAGSGSGDPAGVKITVELKHANPPPPGFRARVSKAPPGVAVALPDDTAAHGY